jgi:hypothetical protein
VATDKKEGEAFASPSHVIYRVGLTFLYQQTRGASIGYQISDGWGFLVVVEMVFAMIYLYL